MITELINLYSYRFDKGYPDFDTIKDQEIFREILFKEFNLESKFEEGKLIFQENLLNLKTEEFQENESPNIT